MPGPLVYSIPMHNRFRGIVVREGLLLRGDAGWGEFSPFWDYDESTSVPWLAAAREAADLGWPAPLRNTVAVNATVPAVDPRRAAQIVHTSGGCRTVKVKVAEPGQTEADDLARVEAVRDAVGPHGRVRVDANAAWDVDTAVRLVRLLDRYSLEYVEQPCRTVEELAELRRRIDVPVAVDETVRQAGDLADVAWPEIADIVVLKVQPLGGVRACLRIADQVGLPVVVSSALETSVGIAAGLALAAALPDLPYACGLATLQLLRTDVTSRPLQVIDGELPVVRPEADNIGEVTADPDTTSRWLVRLAGVEACAAVAVTQPVA